VPDSTPPGTPEPSDEDCEDARGAPDASRQFAATEHSGGAREQERRGTAPRGGDESNDDNMAGGFVVIEDDDDAGGGGFLPPEAEGVGKGQDNESAALAGRPHESVLRPRAVGMGVGHAPAAVPMVAQPPTVCPPAHARALAHARAAIGAKHEIGLPTGCRRAGSPMGESTHPLARLCLWFRGTPAASGSHRHRRSRKPVFFARARVSTADALRGMANGARGRISASRLS